MQATGHHEHPTQALLDSFLPSINIFGELKGLKVAIVGDITHSRVALSNIFALKKNGRTCQGLWSANTDSQTHW